ncbi:CFI-box-CTERM domain-containing protein [Citrobacter werkmanii]|uniref:CFI-box-CTERM domain-containing protein n=1 Tax=Citrobacter werkmanii TaxID=67827 RepID=UPI00351D65CF
MNKAMPHFLDELVSLLQDDPQHDTWSTPWKLLKTACDTLIEQHLLPSNYPEKAALQLAQQQALDRLQVLLRFPQLINHHVICYIGFRGHERDTLLPAFTQSRRFHRANDTIPTLMSRTYAHACHGGITLYQKRCPMNESAILDAFEKTRQHKGELHHFISAFALAVPGAGPAVTLVDIPYRASPDSLYFNGFLDVADTIVLPARSQYLIKRTLNILEQTGSTAQIHLVSIGDGQSAELKSMFPKLAIQETLPPERTSLRPTVNSGIYRELEAIFDEPLLWLEGEIKRSKQIIVNANADLVQNDTDPQVSDVIETMMLQMKTQCDALEEAAQRYRQSLDQLLSQCREVETLVEQQQAPALPGKDAHSTLRDRKWKYAQQRFISLCYAKQISKATRLASDMRLAGYPYVNILELFINELNNMPLNSAHLAELSVLSGCKNEFIYRACLHFRSALKVSDAEAGQRYAANITCRTGEEFYTLGCWKLTTRASEGEKNLRRAYMLGEPLAGDLLLRCIDKKSPAEAETTLRYLANALHPGANYRFGCQFIKDNRHDNAHLHLRIAAALGHLDALKMIARIEYNKYAPSQEMTPARKNALSIYHYLWHTTRGTQDNDEVFLDDDDRYIYGSLLHLQKSFTEAYAILEKCHQARAWTLLGRMNHYGDGKPVNLDLARAYYQKSVSAGDKSATKMLMRLEETAKAKARRENTYNTTYQRTEHTSYSSSSSDSSCFLTTATCRVMGYEDDCEVLQSFRHFRDHVLLTQSEGEKLVGEYYQIAPRLLEKIDARANPQAIYQSMWDDYIKPGYDLLQAGRHQEAKELYIKLVTTLMKTYL